MVENSFSIQFRTLGDESVPVGYSQSYMRLELTGHIDELGLLVENKAIKIFSKDFYANVKGRYSDAPLAPLIIRDILNTELGQSMPVPTNMGDWEYAFTVDKKINSKKLIENIASASPFIPRFRMGEFKFDEIPTDGEPITVDHLHTISEADCIDFSFSRTPIEQVFSKIIFKYNWDYARGEFNDSVTAEMDDSIIEGYSYDYYGFTTPEESDGEGGLIHPDSTLTIDGEQGKYIRNHDTAWEFAHWYLMWSCNQHLKMKVKLPLNYMNLEIGDLVKFDSILGVVYPYGIDYHLQTDGGLVNNQSVFKNFLIVSTSKNLEFCEIECIQMHNLDPTLVGGCTDDTACNYNENATDDNGNCWYPNTGCECEDGQDAIVDCCNVCNGTTECDTCGDCPDSGLEEDECGICGGEGIGEGFCDCAGNIEDCAGVCGGSTSVDYCGVCGGDNSTCIVCNDQQAINYDPIATDDDDCLYPIEATYCPIPEDSVNMPYMNYICSFFPIRCDGFEDGTPNDSVFYIGEGGYENNEAMYAAMHLYCSETDHCISNQGINSEYPLLLKLADCILSPDSGIDERHVKKVELLFYKNISGEVSLLDTLKIYDIDNPVGSDIYYYTQALDPADTDLYSVRIRMTIEHSDSSEDVDISSAIEMSINNQDGGSCDDEEDWNLVSEDQHSYEETLESGATEIEFEIEQPTGSFTFNLWKEYFCGDEESKTHKFKINIISSDQDQEILNTGLIRFDLNTQPCNIELGDINGDGGWNVLDIVVLANMVVNDVCYGGISGTDPIPYNCCATDMNEDGGYNVLDIVILANCVLTGNCAG